MQGFEKSICCFSILQWYRFEEVHCFDHQKVTKYRLGLQRETRDRKTTACSRAESSSSSFQFRNGEQSTESGN
ncbi:hypothetical protein BLNAU_25114 [Blattamonas nauphoetae]|uniref:Uncharacterized protein n=1 Tax=Blattamonas nauphoetae TaxID=2049346 RepID=A0ABQ9WKV5_9EUKA|nr:hypothetical protein BLNAU_25114 [Blattamonas nauphoetae]